MKVSKGNFKKLSYLLNLQILRDLKITIGSAVGIMLLNIAYIRRVNILPFILLTKLLKGSIGDRKSVV